MHKKKRPTFTNARFAMIQTFDVCQVICGKHVAIVPVGGCRAFTRSLLLPRGPMAAIAPPQGPARHVRLGNVIAELTALQVALI
mmetsp:Transcript_49862/g.92049  ORF Transcript_49862/g.92049 Transcript_49862/m.92049 type:complete len:84 (+) Transcript_49862:267-518(+)